MNAIMITIIVIISKMAQQTVGESNVNNGELL